MAFGISPDKLALTPAEVLADMALRRKLRQSQTRSGGGGGGYSYSPKTIKVGTKTGYKNLHYGVGGNLKSRVHRDWTNIHYNVSGRPVSGTPTEEALKKYDAMKRSVQDYLTKKSIDYAFGEKEREAKLQDALTLSSLKQPKEKKLTMTDYKVQSLINKIKRGDFDNELKSKNVSDIENIIEQSYHLPVTIPEIAEALTTRRKAIYENIPGQIGVRPEPYRERPSSMFIKTDKGVYYKDVIEGQVGGASNIHPKKGVYYKDIVGQQAGGANNIVIVHPRTGVSYVYIPNIGYKRIK
mgnify:CR=1 FL=1